MTGANTGIGFETARVLALRGCAVTLACRDLARGDAARERIRSQTNADIRLERVDLGSLRSVREFAAAFLASGRPLHLLINNAGLAMLERQETEDGFEAHFGVNHLGHFLLTLLLEDRLRESAPARVVAVSSHAQFWASLTAELDDLNWEKRPFNGMRAYGDSKLLNLLFTNELNRRLRGSGVVATSVHPGFVRTELPRNSPAWMKLLLVPAMPFARTPGEGASTVLHAATAEEPARSGGGYYANCRPSRTAKLAGNRDVELRAWSIAEELTGLGSSIRERSLAGGV